MQRNNKGSLVTWLLLIGIIGLTIVFGVISLELLIRWVSLGRIQNATKQAALTYARDMIRLKDNKLSSFSGASKNNLTFQQAGIHCSPPADQSGCSALVGSKASIPSSAPYTEYLHASQVLLYNVWGSRISDSAEVDDVRQKQCYKPHEQTRFSLNKEAPENDCVSNNKITSPIMSLEWQFSADPYGYGDCCSSGNSTGKDFCATANVKGRMDPIMAGGLPFLHSIDFIRIGEFNISERVVVPTMDAANSNVDGMFFEPASNGPCPLAPPPAVLPPPGNTPALIGPNPNPPTPPNTSSGGNVEPPPIPDPPPPVGPNPYTPPFNPDCPWGYRLSTINKQDKNSLDYTCDPCPGRGGLINSFCSGNDIASNFHDGNCGSYQQTTQSCQFGCSNATCSPPPPPPPPPAPPNPPVAAVSNSDCVYTIEVNVMTEASLGIGRFAAQFQNDDSTRRSTNSTCFEQILNSCADEFDKKKKEYDDYVAKYGRGFGLLAGSEILRGSIDDANGGCLARYGGIGGQSVQKAPGTSQFIWYLDNQCKPIALGQDSYNKKLQEQIASKVNSLSIHDRIKVDYASMIPKICDSTSYSYVPSPISLILESHQKTITKATHFSLKPSENMSKWYQWKASSSRPLVVYDPKHTGEITSPTQLFGNYTFSKQWSNGYEALVTLDKNLDGKLSGKELKDLALWFDNNQNGISEKGEIKLLSEVGITKLFFKPNTSNIETGDITANIGYERCIKGTCSIGSSVDWFGAGPFDTKQEAILNKQFVAGLGFTQTNKYFVGRN